MAASLFGEEDIGRQYGKLVDCQFWRVTFSALLGLLEKLSQSHGGKLH